MKQRFRAFLLAVAFAVLGVVLWPAIDYCGAGWVQENSFWMWYFNCGD